MTLFLALLIQWHDVESPDGVVPVTILMSRMTPSWEQCWESKLSIEKLTLKEAVVNARESDELKIYCIEMG